MIDPRVSIIGKRFSGIDVYAVSSSKGGVGKTLISVLLSLESRVRGYKVGLLDLDFTNPCCHILLDVDPGRVSPKEEYGVIPPLVDGIRFMSVSYYTMDNPMSLRGVDIDNAFKEILAITLWEDTDLLFIDTPPGLGEEFRDLVGLIPMSRLLVVMTPSILSIRSVDRMMRLLEGRGVVRGIIENMVGDSRLGHMLVDKYGVEYLGWIPFVRGLDDKLGSSDIETVLEEDLKPYIGKILDSLL
jgi:ATP-binding protein involved in chromosome partitioning